MKWILIALAAFIAWRVIRVKYPGFVSSSMFMRSGGLPTILNPNVIVGTLSNGSAIYGPPASGGGGMPGLGTLP